LDKALYGTIEAARLWCETISQKLRDHGSVSNEYDECVMNKLTESRKQITVGFHVDELLATCQADTALDNLCAMLREIHPR
jgi:hypothetical protein